MARKRPKKPYPDFPLSPHASGKWQKKIRGRIHYFGRWDDPQGALREYLEARDYLHAGIDPPSDESRLSVNAICSDFIDAQERRVRSGEIGRAYLISLEKTCQRLVDFFPESLDVRSISPADWLRLRNELGEVVGPTTLAYNIQMIRTIFRWASDRDMIPPVRFGPDFKRPSARTLRVYRSRHGAKLFTADEIHRMIDQANPTYKAMILLGLNSGFGMADCSRLEKKHVNFDEELIRFARTKTGIDRTVPLWPETVEAIQRQLKPRTHLVFVGKTGRPFYATKTGQCRSIHSAFRNIRKRAGCHRQQAGFYTFRHVFATVGGGCKDQVAVNHIMGHSDASMAAVYREDVSLDRLKAVTEHVREWFLNKSRNV